MNITSISHHFSYITKSDHNSIYAPFPGYTVSPQSHDCYEMVFYDKGCVGVTSIDGIDYEFKAGDIAFIHRKIIHSEKHLSEGVLYFFGFHIDNPDFSPLPPSGLYTDIWDAKSVVYAMFKEQVNQEYNYKRMLSIKIEEILLMLQRKLTASTGQEKNLKYVRNYMQENYAQNISVETLARMTGYSIAHFRDIFTEEYGVSPKTYLVNLRCQAAAEMLIDTNMSCTDIAYHCGFSNSGQLSVMLKKKYGKKPLEIRKYGIDYYK